MLKEHRYNILIVSSGEKFNASVIRLLSLSINASITESSSINQARRLLLERNFDIVIINSPVGAENGTEFAISLADDNSFGIMLFAKAADYNEAYDKAHEFGVYVLSKPTDADLFVQSLRVLCSTRDRLQTISKNPVSFKEKLDEIKLVNEAKLLLIKIKHITEDEAHKMIEHQAMDFRVSKKRSAEIFIKELSSRG